MRTANMRQHKNECDVLGDVSDSDDEQEVYYECNEHDDGKSDDFLFKDSYFEDRELDGLEYCYEPGIALGQMEYGTDLAPIYRKVSTSGTVHCFGCRCQRMSQFGPCGGCHRESGLPSLFYGLNNLFR